MHPIQSCYVGHYANFSHNTCSWYMRLNERYFVKKLSFQTIGEKVFKFLMFFIAQGVKDRSTIVNNEANLSLIM